MLLAIVMVLGVFVIPASAETGIQPYASSYFNSAYVTATKSGSTMTIVVSASTASSMTTLYASNICVQKWNGSYWESVCTFGGLSNNNGKSLYGTYSYTVTSSGTYRAHAYFYASNSSGSSSDTRNSSSQYF